MVLDCSRRAVKQKFLKMPKWTVGVCALDTKARSKPMTTILDNLISFQEFDVKIFGDKVILDEEIGINIIADV